MGKKVATKDREKLIEPSTSSKTTKKASKKAPPPASSSSSSSTTSSAATTNPAANTPSTSGQQGKIRVSNAEFLAESASGEQSLIAPGNESATAKAVINPLGGFTIPKIQVTEEAAQTVESDDVMDLAERVHASNLELGKEADTSVLPPIPQLPPPASQVPPPASLMPPPASQVPPPASQASTSGTPEVDDWTLSPPPRPGLIPPVPAGPNVVPPTAGEQMDDSNNVLPPQDPSEDGEVMDQEEDAAASFNEGPETVDDTMSESSNSEAGFKTVKARKRRVFVPPNAKLGEDVSYEREKVRTYGEWLKLFGEGVFPHQVTIAMLAKELHALRRADQIKGAAYGPDEKADRKSAFAILFEAGRDQRRLLKEEADYTARAERRKQPQGKKRPAPSGSKPPTGAVRHSLAFVNAQKAEERARQLQEALQRRDELFPNSPQRGSVAQKAPSANPVSGASSTSGTAAKVANPPTSSGNPLDIPPPIVRYRADIVEVLPYLAARVRTVNRPAIFVRSDDELSGDAWDSFAKQVETIPIVFVHFACSDAKDSVHRLIIGAVNGAALLLCLPEYAESHKKAVDLSVDWLEALPPRAAHLMRDKRVIKVVRNGDFAKRRFEAAGLDIAPIFSMGDALRRKRTVLGVKRPIPEIREGSYGPLAFEWFGVDHTPAEPEFFDEGVTFEQMYACDYGEDGLQRHPLKGKWIPFFSTEKFFGTKPVGEEFYFVHAYALSEARMGAAVLRHVVLQHIKPLPPRAPVRPAYLSALHWFADETFNAEYAEFSEWSRMPVTRADLGPMRLSELKLSAESPTEMLGFYAEAETERAKALKPCVPRAVAEDVDLGRADHVKVDVARSTYATLELVSDFNVAALRENRFPLSDVVFREGEIRGTPLFDPAEETDRQTASDRQIPMKNRAYASAVDLNPAKRQKVSGDSAFLPSRCETRLIRPFSRYEDEENSVELESSPTDKHKFASLSRGFFDAPLSSLSDVCPYCGDQHPEAKFPGAKVYAGCANYRTAKFSCRYAFCPPSKRTLHQTRFCDTLHSLCDSCGLRGHRGEHCEKFALKDFQVLFEFSAWAGLLTRRRFSSPHYGFFGFATPDAINMALDLTGVESYAHFIRRVDVHVAIDTVQHCNRFVKGCLRDNGQFVPIIPRPQVDRRLMKAEAYKAELDRRRRLIRDRRVDAEVRDRTFGLTWVPCDSVKPFEGDDVLEDRREGIVHAPHGRASRFSPGDDLLGCVEAALRHQWARANYGIQIDGFKLVKDVKRPSAEAPSAPSSSNSAAKAPMPNPTQQPAPVAAEMPPPAPTPPVVRRRTPADKTVASRY